MNNSSGEFDFSALTLNDDKKENGGVCVPVFDSVLTNELSDDFILPDTMPDISKILRVRSSPRLIGSVCDGGRLEYEGSCSYGVLYLADDKTVKCAAFSSQFTGSSAISSEASSDGGELGVHISPQIASCACRMLNPRKLNLKTRLETSATVMDKRSCESKLDGQHSLEDEVNLERDNADVESAVISCVSENSCKASGDIELDGTFPQIAELITCDVLIFMYECKYSSDKLQCRGDAVANVIYSGDDGSVVSVTRRLPVSCQVDCEGISDGVECTARAYAGEIRSEAAPNSYGEKRVIQLDMDYSVFILAARNTTCEITRDAYSTEFECSLTTEKLPLTVLNRVICGNFSVNLMKSREELSTASAAQTASNAPDAAKTAAGILDASASAKITSVRLDPMRMKLICEGTIEVCMVTLSDGGDMGQLCFSEPIKAEFDGSDVDEDFGYNAETYVIASKGRLDTANLYGDFEVAVVMSVFGRRETQVVTSIALDRSVSCISSEPSPLTLYYPEKGETLWNIAKHYHTTRHAIETANSLPENPPKIDANVLIIPRRSSKSLYSDVIE